MEILRIEVNTCELLIMCPSNKGDQSNEVSAIVGECKCGHIRVEVYSGGSVMWRKQRKSENRRVNRAPSVQICIRYEDNIVT